MDYRKIGVDLGTYSIKMIEIKEVSDLFERKCAKTYVVGKNKTEKEYYLFLKKCILDFLKINKIKFALFSFTIPCNEPDAILKFITMPVVDKKTLQKSLRYEIEEKEIAKNFDDIYYNWEIIKNYDVEQESEYNILLAVIKKKIIKELSKLKTVHWQIENIELQPITVGRLISGDSVVVDFGHKGTKVYMYKDGNLSNTEILDIGGLSFSELIAHKFSLMSADEIEGTKHQTYIINDFIENHGVDEVKTASTLITEESKNLFNEIKRLNRSFELQNNIIIEQVYYLGGTVNIEYFVDLFTKELEIPVKALELLTPKEENGILEDLREYTLASSAIIYKKYKYFNDLNFSKNAKFQLELTPIIVGLICAAVIAHAGTYYTNNKYDGYITDISKVQTQQKSVTNELNTKISSINSKNSAQRSSIDSINMLLNQNKWLSDIMYILPDKVPKNTIVSDVVCVDGSITLTGYTSNYSDIGFFAIALEEFGKVTVNTIDNEVTMPESTGSVGGGTTSISPKVSKTFVITLKYTNPRLDLSELQKAQNALQVAQVTDNPSSQNVDMPVNGSIPNDPTAVQPNQSVLPAGTVQNDTTKVPVNPGTVTDGTIQGNPDILPADNAQGNAQGNAQVVVRNRILPGLGLELGLTIKNPIVKFGASKPPITLSEITAYHLEWGSRPYKVEAVNTVINQTTTESLPIKPITKASNINP